MTIEEMQQLAELTETAAKSNDIESLIKIAKIIDDDLSNTETPTNEGAEWFYSSLTSEQMEAVVKNL